VEFRDELIVGLRVGGIKVGSNDGWILGSYVEFRDELMVGLRVGGIKVGSNVGLNDGSNVG